MRRRQALAAAGVGATGLLAGCSRFEDGGTETETPEGQWELRARVANEDDQSHDWQVECRSPTGSAASASGTLPAGEVHEIALSGRVRDEELSVSFDAAGGAVNRAWRPTECRELSADASIVDGEPSLETDCENDS